MIPHEAALSLFEVVLRGCHCRDRKHRPEIHQKQRKPNSAETRPLSVRRIRMVDTFRSSVRPENRYF